MRAGSFTRSVPIRRWSPGAIVQLRSKRNRRRWAGIEVADGAAQEGDQAPPAGGDPAQVPVEVADDRVHLQARVVVHQPVGRRPQELVAHVEGDVAPQRARRRAMASSRSRVLSQAPAPSSTRVSASASAGDVAGVAPEQVALGPRRVVLG